MSELNRRKFLEGSAGMAAATSLRSRVFSIRLPVAPGPAHPGIRLISSRKKITSRPGNSSRA